MGQCLCKDFVHQIIILYGHPCLKMEVNPFLLRVGAPRDKRSPLAWYVKLKNSKGFGKEKANRNRNSKL